MILASFSTTLPQAKYQEGLQLMKVDLFLSGDTDLLAWE